MQNMSTGDKYIREFDSRTRELSLGILANAIPTPIRRLTISQRPPVAKDVCLFDSEFEVLKWTDGVTIDRVYGQKSADIARELYKTFGEVYFCGWVLNDEVRASEQAAKDKTAAKRLAAKESMNAFKKKYL